MNYSPEFREEADRMVMDSSRPIAHVAREIGAGDVKLGGLLGLALGWLSWSALVTARSSDGSQPPWCGSFFG
ncbi:MAG: hypothetical protein ACRDRL_21595 [Sciscionella sp.]